LGLPPSVRIYFATGLVDMRNGINGLRTIVEQVPSADRWVPSSLKSAHAPPRSGPCAASRHFRDAGGRGYGHYIPITVSQNPANSLDFLPGQSPREGSAVENESEAEGEVVDARAVKKAKDRLIPSVEAHRRNDPLISRTPSAPRLAGRRRGGSQRRSGASRLSVGLQDSAGLRSS
jgi:hypothetical protein